MRRDEIDPDLPGIRLPGRARLTQEVDRRWRMADARYQEGWTERDRLAAEASARWIAEVEALRLRAMCWQTRTMVVLALLVPTWIYLAIR